MKIPTHQSIIRILARKGRLQADGYIGASSQLGKALARSGDGAIWQTYIDSQPTALERLFPNLSAAESSLEKDVNYEWRY